MIASVKQAAIPAAVAAVISLGWGLVTALTNTARIRAAGLGGDHLSYAWETAVERWAGLALTTSLSVFVVLLLSRIARQRRSWLLAAVLVLFAPLVLFIAGVAAYWPARSLIRQGWFVNVGEVALFWGVLCGGSVVALSEFIYWLLSRRSRRDPPDVVGVTIE